MEKPIIQTSGTLTLMKPASKSDQKALMNDAVKAVEAYRMKLGDVTTKEVNKLVDRRAPRGLKLVKPAPRKSKINKDKTKSSVSSVRSVPHLLFEPCDSAAAVDVLEQSSPELIHLSEKIAEEGISVGHFTADGRHGIYRLCHVDERNAETTVNLLQYSPKELLKLGTSDFSKQIPDSWPYLIQFLPNICLDKVYGFDVEQYSLERDNVVEVHNVVGRKDDTKIRKTLLPLPVCFDDNTINRKRKTLLPLPTSFDDDMKMKRRKTLLPLPARFVKTHF